MKLSDFNYHLPEELIAQFPLEERSASRLLVLDPHREPHLRDSFFKQLKNELRPQDLLVFNNTKVIPARLFGRKQTGGQVEVMLERIIGEREAIAQIRASKSPTVGSRILIENDAHQLVIEVLERQDHSPFYRLGFSQNCLDSLELFGQLPLPPYIDHQAGANDQQRYQTVYAEKPGAVAAPTAGLHFDDAILSEIDAMGVQRTTITLHVGAGTFSPVRHENLAEHQMHSEWYEISDKALEQIRQTQAAGGRVIAVGTTSLRTLESYANSGITQGDTNLFITPGYTFKMVDCLITNFHLPQSTLLMLVSAFSGYEAIMKAYQHAIQEKYRFFSYGDAMFLNKQ
jgi:S-adenosylmethionine:tRNA ribosyltransferase-isomerase